MLIPSFLFIASLLSVALSFNVTVGSPPSQCGALNLTWSGGQPPFQIMLIPTFDVPRNISVPSTAFSNNRGSYQISPIPFFNKTQFMVLMSDATGFATGGISELLPVGEPASGADCNTTSPFLPFTFSLPSSLEQCSPYTFSGYDGAVFPVTITGFIPEGDFFMLHPPSTGTSYTWPAVDVPAGTRIVFAMTDANGNSGGAADAQAVTYSNTASCLNSSSPSSTLGSVPFSTSTAASQLPSNSQTSSSGVSTGTIIGVAVATVVAVAVIATLAVCYLKRQRYGRTPYGLASTRNSRRPNSVELDPGMDNLPRIYPFPYQSDSAGRLPPSAAPGSSTALTSYQETYLTRTSVSASEVPNAYQRHSRTNSNNDSFVPFGGVASTSMSSSGRRKAAMAGVPAYQSTTRYIVHTDAEDDVPLGEPEVVELPPQYSERRTPLIDHPETTLTSGSSSTGLAYLSGQGVDEPLRSSSHPPAP